VVDAALLRLSVELSFGGDATADLRIVLPGLTTPLGTGELLL
jgi:hypothetical protein